MNVQVEFYDGAEGYTAAQAPEVWTSGTIGAMAAGRQGGQAMQTPSNLTRTLGAYSDAFLGVAVFPQVSGVVNLRLMGAGSVQTFLQWNPATGIIQAFRGDNVLISAVSGIYSAGSWHEVRLACTAATGATGRIWVMVDGTVALSLSSVQTCPSAGSTTYDGIQLQSASPSLLDDVYARFGTSGTPEGADLGDLVLLEGVPGAQGNYHAFTPDGGAGGNPHYTRYNEAIDDDDLTYVESGTPGNRESWTPVAFSSTIGTIKVAVHRCFSRLVSSGTPRALRMFTRASGTDHDSSNVHNVPSVNFQAIDEVMLVNPATSAAWANAAEVNATEFGFKLES
jgi:hypothetical protein